MDGPVEDWKDDKLFEPTVDMMVNDFDDEQTMEEEEKLADPQLAIEELDNLQREGELPIEELLRLYNCPPPMATGSLDRLKSKKPRKKRKLYASALVNNNTDEKAEGEEATTTTETFSRPSEPKSARLSEEIDKETPAASASGPDCAVPSACDDQRGNQKQQTKDNEDEEEVPSTGQFNHSSSSTAIVGEDSDASAVAATAAGDDLSCSQPPTDADFSATGEDLDDEELEEEPSELVKLLEDVNDEEEEADYDYYPDEADFKKCILVGENHQAAIPDIVFPRKEQSPPADQLLWSPHSEKVHDGAVERFLTSFYKLRRHLNQQHALGLLSDSTATPAQSPSSSSSLVPSPEEIIAQAEASHPATTSTTTTTVTGTTVKDEESALLKLLEADYNVEVALQQVCNLMQANGGTGVIAPPTGTAATTNSLGYSGTTPVGTWSEEECRNFELGIRLYGKNFPLIQQLLFAQSTPAEVVVGAEAAAIHSSSSSGGGGGGSAGAGNTSKSVSELVQFYYFWKKTDRYDSFAAKQRLEKKKHSSQNPGLTEFMDKFLEEQQQRSISPRQTMMPMHASAISATTVSQQNHQQQQQQQQAHPLPPMSMMAGGVTEGSSSGGGVGATGTQVSNEVVDGSNATISDGNHSLLIYADSKRHRTSGGAGGGPLTPPVMSGERHPLEEFSSCSGGKGATMIEGSEFEAVATGTTTIEDS